MHHDALTALGEALRREFDDRLHHSEMALPDVVEEAQQLLTALDSQMQALAAWLTSSSVAVLLSSTTSGEELGNGRHTPLSSAVGSAWPTDVRRPGAESGPPLRREPSLSGEQLAAVRFARQTGSASRGQEATVSSPTRSAAFAAPAASPAVPALAPPDDAAASPVPSAPGPTPPTPPAVRLTTLPHGVVATTDATTAPLPLDDQGAPGSQTAVWLETPQPTALPGEAVAGPEETVSAPPAQDAFTAVKTLHDLTRFLALGEHATAASTATAAPDNGGAGGEQSNTGEEHPVVLTDVRRLVTLPLQERTAQPPAQEPWPAPPPASGPGSALPHDKVREDSMPGTWAVTSTHTAGPEVDIESVLDAVSRQVAEDYRRFYGSI